MQGAYALARAERQVECPAQVAEAIGDSPASRRAAILRHPAFYLASRSAIAASVRATASLRASARPAK